jgi:hypothetical protein
MSGEPEKPGLKHKVEHEFMEITIVFLYLAVFFCALSTYSMLLLEKFRSLISPMELRCLTRS